MPDGFNARILTADVDKAFAAIGKSADRSTMYTVRQAARKVGQYAKKAAPTYKGPARSRYYAGQNIGPMAKGDLKKSIHSLKRLKRIPGGYAVTVGPRGAANIYAAIQERRTPFMGPAKDRVDSEIKAIAEKAWGQSMRRG